MSLSLSINLPFFNNYSMDVSQFYVQDSIHPSIHPSIDASMHTCIYFISMHPCTDALMHPSHTYIHASTHISMHSCTLPFIQSSINPSIHPASSHLFTQKKNYIQCALIFLVLNLLVGNLRTQKVISAHCGEMCDSNFSRRALSNIYVRPLWNSFQPFGLSKPK